MLAAKVQFRRVVELTDDAVDAGTDEALAAQICEELVVLAFAGLDDRREQQESRSLGEGQGLVDHLTHGLGAEVPAVSRAPGCAGPRKQQPQVVVDLGDGADGGAWVVRGSLLFDGNGRGQPFDMVHVRLVHHGEELPGIGRQRFHIASLPLGIDGVESQRGLARTREPGDHNQPVPGQVQVHVTQIVGPRSADADLLHGRREGGQTTHYTAPFRPGGSGRSPGLRAATPGRYPPDALHNDIARNPGGNCGGAAYNAAPMARGINKVILIGNLGQDPETRYMPSGSAVTNLRIATTDSFKDKDTGEKQERTEWHSVAMFGRLAEISAEYLKKGSQVYIEGRLRTRKWQDKEGKDRYTTEIIADEMQMLGGRGGGMGAGGGSDSDGSRSQSPGRPAKQPQPAAAGAGDAGEFDDDIPF